MKELKNLTDSQLVQLALEQNPLANTKLFNDHKNLINYLIYKKGINQTDADDLLMIVFEKIYSKLLLFNGEKGSLKSWIITITNNTIIDYFRKNNNKYQTVYITLINSEENEYTFDFASSSKTDAEIITKESIALLYNVIDKLPNKYKSIIDLLIEDKNNNEIAQILETTPNAIGVQKMRALAQLKQLLVTL